MTRRWMLRALGVFGLAGSARIPLAAQTPAPTPRPRTVWNFYRVKWGFQDEWIDLFRRNHYPVLRESVKRGRISSIRTFAPMYHGDGRADWTFAVELVFPSAEAAVTPGDPDIVRQLYPDQDKFRREEQRRFELLDAHWDVPLNDVSMER